MNKMMWPPRSWVQRWGLLAVGLLAGGAMVLHGAQHRDSPRAFSRPVYALPQVLAGWHNDPGAWAGRTILVRGRSAYSCVLPAAFDPYGDGRGSAPCVQPWDGPIYSVLYDSRTVTFLPTIFSGRRGIWLDNPTMAPSWFKDIPVASLRLAVRQDCGPLGKGQHPCLVGQDPTPAFP